MQKRILKINIIEETLSRENPDLTEYLFFGKIGVYVFPDKEKLSKDKAKIIRNKKGRKSSEK